MSKCWFFFFTHLLCLHTRNPCCDIGLKKAYKMAIHGFITYAYLGEFSRWDHEALYLESSAKHQTVLNHINLWITESICFQEAGFPSGGKEGPKTVYPYRPWPGSLKQLLHKCLSCLYCIKTAAVHPRFSSVQGNFHGKLMNTPIAHLILSPLLPQLV